MRSAVLAATLALALLAACGQKGPLYLPDQDGNVIVRPATETGPVAAPTPADEDAEAKKQPPP
jgi:predicted small lipoprotein YifL